MRPTPRLILMASLLALLLTPLASPARASTGEYYPTSGWRTSTPEAQGMATKNLQEMNDHIRVNAVSIDGLVVIRHGYLVWEYYPNPEYDANALHYLYSVTKSFTSCLIGLATLIILIEAKPRKPDDPHGEDTRKPPTFRTHHLTR